MAMSDTTRPDGDDNSEAAFDGEHANDASPAIDGENAELELDDDTSLPWLEGADDEDEYQGYNTGQLVAYVVLGFLLLGLIVGGIWWATHRNSEGDLVADGSVIEAPEGDYKTRPEDPGGKTFEGTGDSSFAVSEGESRPAQLGKDGSAGDRSGDAAAARPGFDAVDGGKPDSGQPDTAATDSAPAPAPAASSGVGVQVGAYSTRASAEANWAKLTQSYSALKGMKYRVVEGKVDIGTVYRLQALPGDLAAAKALCGKLSAAGLACHVKK